MEIYSIVFNATVGNAYVRAVSSKSAIRKLARARVNHRDTDDVKFTEWEPELLDICEQDVECLEPDEAASVSALLFVRGPKVALSLLERLKEAIDAEDNGRTKDVLERVLEGDRHE